MKETIIQFGEGNFLRAFADDFINELNKKGLYDGKVVIVKPTPRGNLDKFEEQKCVYNLLVRGIKDTEDFSEIKEINSLSRCVNPYSDFDEFLALAKNKDAKIIISNTTEAGIVFDEKCEFSDRPALSFPAKLTQLLFERYKAGLDGFIILPCELIDNNAKALKDCVLRYAEEWELEEGFIKWINEKNRFINTLVDRIVSGYPKEEAEIICRKIGYNDKLLDTAEPYHLWAIEANIEDDLPLKEAGVNVVYTDDIAPIKKRKVRLLNGTHTAIVFPAMLCGAKTVDECFKDEDLNEFLRAYLFKTALAVLAKSDENEDFADAIIERFKNPYLHHRLESISLNSVSKFRERIAPTVAGYKAIYGFVPKNISFSLSALIYYYKNYPVSDDKETVEFIKRSSVFDILKSGIFGVGPEIGNDVSKGIEFINDDKIREGLRWALS